MTGKTLPETEIIHRSPQEVWETITTIENWAAWYTAGLSGVSPGWQEGATLNFVTGEKPVISRCAPPGLLRWGKGTEIRLAAVDATTTEITYSHAVGGVFAQDPMLLAEYENMFSADAAKMLGKLKRLAESQAPLAESQAPLVESPPPAPPPRQNPCQRQIPSWSDRPSRPGQGPWRPDRQRTASLRSCPPGPPAPWRPPSRRRSSYRWTLLRERRAPGRRRPPSRRRHRP